MEVWILPLWLSIALQTRSIWSFSCLISQWPSPSIPCFQPQLQTWWILVKTWRSWRRERSKVWPFPWPVPSLPNWKFWLRIFSMLAAVLTHLASRSVSKRGREAWKGPARLWYHGRSVSHSFWSLLLGFFTAKSSVSFSRNFWLTFVYRFHFSFISQSLLLGITQPQRAHDSWMQNWILPALIVIFGRFISNVIEFWYILNAC